MRTSLVLVARLRHVALIAAASSAALLAPTAPASAATFNATALTDMVDLTPGDGVCAASDGSCTFRAAVMESNALPGVDSIILQGARYRLVRSGGDEDVAATGDLDITDAVTITGAGAMATIIEQVLPDRVIDVHASGSLDISGVQVTGGQLTSDLVVGTGGGAGIRSTGTLRVARSWITGNSMTIEASRSGGGLAVTGGTAIVEASTFSRNRSSAYGQAATSSGGSLTITNSSAFDNQNDSQGGVLHAIGGGTMALRFVTVIGNGTWGIGAESGGTLTATGVFVADNTSGCLAASATGVTFTGGNVITSDSAAAPCVDGADSVSVRADVGPLPFVSYDAAARVPLLALPVQSAAVDAGGDCAGLVAVDARGGARSQGAACDAGAFERGAISDLAASALAGVETTVPGEQIGFTLTVRNRGSEESIDARASLSIPTMLDRVSVTSSSGTCAGSPITCSFGTMAAGDAVTIVVRGRARTSGNATVSIAATHTGVESDTANDAASATTSIAADRSRPRTSLVASKLRIGMRSAVARYRVRCPETEVRCRIVVEARVGRRIATRRTIRILGGATAAVPIKLNRTELRAIRRKRRPATLRVRIRADTIDASGNRLVRTLAGTIRR